MLYILSTTLQLGIIYAFVSLALFISFRLLDIADLSTDGTFILGMCMSVSLAIKGHPVLGILLAIISCAISGSITAILQTYMHIPSILAGIIVNTALYTINLMVMSFSSNLSLLKQETIFSLANSSGLKYSEIIIPLLLFIVISILLNCFLKTRLGLSIRATGDNPEMVSASSINPNIMIIIGLAISNSLTGLSGALIGQLQRSADINSSTGIVVIGLACLIIGEAIIKNKNINTNILATLIGSIVYRFLYAIILKTRIFPIEYLKLITAIIITIAISSQTLKKGEHNVTN